MSRFSTKYSTPEYRVVMAITATHTVLSQPGIGRNMSTMHTMVLAVFTLPDQPAAITRPLSLAIIRRPLTANSRTRTDQQRPGRHLADLHEPEQCRRHQHFIRQRIGKLAEIRD